MNDDTRPRPARRKFFSKSSLEVSRLCHVFLHNSSTVIIKRHCPLSKASGWQLGMQAKTVHATAITFPRANSQTEQSSTILAHEGLLFPAASPATASSGCPPPTGSSHFLLESYATCKKESRRNFSTRSLLALRRGRRRSALKLHFQERESSPNGHSKEQFRAVIDKVDLFSIGHPAITFPGANSAYSCSVSFSRLQLRTCDYRHSPNSRSTRKLLWSQLTEH